MSDVFGTGVRGSVNKDPAEPAMKRAMQALRARRADMAEPILLEILRSQPNHINATRSLAECAIAHHDHEHGLMLLERCIALAPKFDAARYRYVSLLYLQNRLQDALPHLDTLLERDPQNPQVRTLNASIVGQLGDNARSLALLEVLVREHPRHVPAWVSYGHALKVASRPDESIAAYRKATELMPELGDGYWGLANLKTFRFTMADIAEIKRQLARDDLGAGARVQFHFSLGKAHEDLRQYGEAFESYHNGNALWRSTIAYDAGEIHAFAERCKSVLTANFFQKRSGFGHKARDPIFIVGLPRAGSTLIEQILSSHSQIEGTMELPNIPALARHLSERRIAGRETQYPDVLADLDAGEFERHGIAYLENTAVQRKMGRRFFVDKMPNNFAHIALIHLILPNARIIDARRHPMGCCFSNYKQFFERGQRFTFSLSDIGRYYRDYVELMAHWDAVLPGKVHRIIYEELVNDPETEIRRLLDYLDLPFEEACLRFHETERTVRTSSSEQVRQPLHKGGVDQWKHFERWLDPLKEALGPDVLS